MNETVKFETFSTSHVCRVCLKTASDLPSMSNEHVDLFRNLVDQVAYQDSDMKICIICQWVLRKFSKFKLQCWTANNMLTGAAYEVAKPIQSLQNLRISHCFQQTLPENFHTYSHTNTADTNDNSDDLKDNSDSDLYDILDTAENDHYINDCHTDNYKSTASEKCAINDVEDDMKMENLRDFDNNLSEDEIPLLFLPKNNDQMPKKKSKMSSKDKALGSVKELKFTQDEESTLSNKSYKHGYKIRNAIKRKYNISKTKQICKESKKKLQDGFSSRMVQETSEYVVIKLTKEQVLLELAERAKTDVYINLPYKCDTCVKGFNFQEVLEKHLEKHSKKNGPLQCDMCGQYCPSAVSLRGHIKSHTTRYKCKVCGDVKLSRQHLLEHHAAHLGAGVTYCCDSCPFTTNKRTVMQRHARSHSRVPHACHICGAHCRTVGSLRVHIARHNNSLSHYKCTQCDKSFIYYSLLKNHVQYVHETRDLYCVECDVHFTSPASLRAHFKKAKRHRDSVDYKHVCKACGRRFFTASSLAAHMCAAHEAARTHACTHCHKHYSSREVLRSHVWRLHSRAHSRGDSPATCDHCGTTFARKSTLTIHLRTHAGAGTH